MPSMEKIQAKYAERERIAKYKESPKPFVHVPSDRRQGLAPVKIKQDSHVSEIVEIIRQFLQQSPKESYRHVLDVQNGSANQQRMVRENMV